MSRINKGSIHVFLIYNKIEGIKQMGFETSLSDCVTYIHIDLMQTPMTVERTKELIKFGVGLLHSYGIRKFLIDAHDSPHDSTIMNQYDLAYHYARSMGLSRPIKIAVIKDQDDRSRDFIETVFNNAGYCYKLFSDDEDAVHWLKTDTMWMLMMPASAKDRQRIGI
jgi:hypothetical protein